MAVIDQNFWFICMLKQKCKYNQGNNNFSQTVEALIGGRVDLGQALQTKILNTWLFLVLKIDDVQQVSFTVYQLNWHDPRNKNVYDLWLGISLVFRIFGHFLFKKESGPLPGPMIYIPFDALWHKEKEYTWFRGGDLNRLQDI